MSTVGYLLPTDYVQEHQDRMKTFETSLLREKFVITDKDARPGSAAAQGLVVLSNRMNAVLRNSRGQVHETYVVRGQNMHSVVRMISRILFTFRESGPLSNRAKPYDWDKAWEAITSNYEYAYNPDRWLAIYQDGKCIFSSGDHHPFLDMIEKCEHSNTNDYDFAIPMAEDLFKKAGKNLVITHDSNVALNVHFEDNECRSGIILRSPNKTTTFSFNTRTKKSIEALNLAQCLAASAAFLEGIQLAFNVGMDTEKYRIGIIERFSKEEKKMRDGRQRLSRLSGEISNMEDTYEVRYRPEKPEFHHFITEAEELGQRILEPPEPKAEEPPEDGGDHEDDKNEKSAE